MLAVPSLVAVWFVLIRSRKAVQGTTLQSAWFSAVVTAAVWSGVWVGTQFAAGMSPAVRSHLWYAVAVVALCPGVSVLGARRPVADVWPVFVLLPMIAVFSIPALTTLWRGGLYAPLQLEMPTVLGWAFVLVMGYGNYLLTRFVLPVLLAAASCVCILWPVSGLGSDGIMRAESLLSLGTIGLGAACLLAVLTARHSPQTETGSERVWNDFRNIFGIVWAKRVMDRVNWSAQEEDWPLRLDLSGVIWTKPDVTGEERAEALKRLEATFRWLLKRFVDDAWLHRRLG